ncbi:MAG: D-aminoacyl-tRNA deacylase [Bacteroidales bacterium]|nr:D-aminoacyl-tRNA deacylase [Bacteroidales bacterium]
MRTLIQRVTHAEVVVDGKEISRIEQGLMVLVGIEEADTTNDIEYLATKLVKLRIFDDENGVMNLSVTDVAGDVMVVSQFTLMAATQKGNRPSYIRAAKPDISKPLYEAFCTKVESLLGKSVAKGIFGADMKVTLLNNGPVTIWMDSKNKE